MNQYFILELQNSQKAENRYDFCLTDVISTESSF